MCGGLSHAPDWGPGTQHRYVPSLGIEPVTLWFTGRAQSTEPHLPGLQHFKRKSTRPVAGLGDAEPLGIKGLGVPFTDSPGSLPSEE